MPSSILELKKLDYVKAERELDEFKAWLDVHAECEEYEIVGELKARPDLCLLIQLAAGKGYPDSYKFEFNLQGAFRADLVTGSTTEKHFVLVEFEGARRDSIFKPKRRNVQQLADWGNPLQHAFSQVSDWTWAKNDNQKSVLYQNAFGMAHMTETYLIVCGRSAFLDGIDESRLHWRSEQTMIAGRHIRFWTYDQLHENCSDAMSVFRAARLP